MGQCMNINPQTSRRDHGFTLIELLAVMAVLAILGGMVFGIAGIAGRKSADAACIGELEAWRNLLEDFKAKEGYYPASASLSRLLNVMNDPTFSAYFNSVEREVDFEDPWETDYLYQRKSRFRYLIGSRGPDARHGERGVDSNNASSFGKFDDITNENGRMN